MKKIAMICGALCVLSSTAAHAELAVNFDFLAPEYEPAAPVYVQQPAPEYVVAPSYPAYYQNRHYHHRDHDARRVDHRGPAEHRR